MRNIFRAVDLLTLSFLALCSIITLLFSSAIPNWAWLMTQYLLIALVISAFTVYARKEQAWKPAVYLYSFLPVLIIPIIFNSLGDLIPWLWPRYLDDILIRIDYALFGVHPTVWMERLIHPVLTMLLQLAYISYYPMPVVLVLILFMKNKSREFDEAMFGLLLCFYLSYIGYILVPAIGPRFTLIEFQTMSLQAGPVTLSIQEALNTLEHNKADAFPSGHTAIALQSLYYAWKAKEKILSRALIPIVASLIFSTVYLRYHYVIDVIAGIGLAVLSVSVAPQLYRWFSGSTEHANQ